MPKLFNPADPERPLDVEYATQLLGSRPRQVIVRYVVRHPGAWRSDLVSSIGLPAGSLSGHLHDLEHMGVLISDISKGERAGRSVRYYIDVDRVRQLMSAWGAYVLGDRST